MTQLLGSPGRTDAEASQPPRRRVDVASVLVVLATGWWLTGLAQASGGRAPHVVSLGCLAVGAALLAVRPWRTLSPLVLGGATAISAAAFGVVVFAPTGAAGVDEAASYTYAAYLAVLLIAWARSEERRLLLLAVVAAAGLYQFLAGWLAWWGHDDPATLFLGTYYWHNQAGIAMALGALAGAALVARGGADALHVLGWLTAPLCTCGTLLSGSRGSQLGLALGLALLLLAGVCDGWSGAQDARPHARLRGLLRMVVLAGSSWAVGWLMTGPPFFGARASVLSATASRGDTLEANGVQRLEDWRRAGEIFRHWPVTGAGFNSYSSATSLVTERRDGVDTAFAHNGFLQVLSDGGLLLGVPVLGAIACLTVVALRRSPGALRHGDWARIGAITVLAVALLHSGMDFDWSYPALLATTAVAGALVAAPLDLSPHRTTGTAWVPRVLVVAGLVLLVLAAVLGWSGGLALSAQVRPT